MVGEMLKWLGSQRNLELVCMVYVIKCLHYIAINRVDDKTLVKCFEICNYAPSGPIECNNRAVKYVYRHRGQSKL